MGTILGVLVNRILPAIAILAFAAFILMFAFYKSIYRSKYLYLDDKNNVENSTNTNLITTLRNSQLVKSEIVTKEYSKSINDTKKIRKGKKKIGETRRKREEEKRKRR